MIIYELGPIDVWFGWIPFNKSDCDRRVADRQARRVVPLQHRSSARAPSRRLGITMRMLRHAGRALDIPWNQRRDNRAGCSDNIKVTYIDHGDWIEEQWEPNPAVK
jgi:hypothetical protein